MSTERPILATLFPGLSPEDQDEARRALRRYFAFVVRLHARIASDPAEREHFTALTEQCGASSMDSGRTFTNEYFETHV